MHKQPCGRGCCGWARLQDFRFPAHSHEHLCIGLWHEGEYSSRYGLRRYWPQRGDVVFVNPGERLLGVFVFADAEDEAEAGAFYRACGAEAAAATMYSFGGRG